MTQREAPTGPVILRASVEIVPVRSFPLDVQQQIGGEAGDYVLSDLAARMSSKRIDASTAGFLLQFRQACDIATAVARHARQVTRDPSELLLELYPLLSLLLDNDMLASPDAVPARQPGRAFQPGDVLDNLQIVRCVAELAETEIYQASTPDGEPLAIKVLRPGGAAFVRQSFDRELGILEHLRGQGCDSAPAPIRARLDAPQPYLALEWVPGDTAWNMVFEDELPLEQRATIVRNLLRAYAQIHEAGVLHGDVHPRNIMVTPANGVRVLDFGAARVSTTEVVLDRLGVVPYYEPEVARALLESRTPPQPTFLGEQYTIAVSAYFILTQSMYLALSLEANAALQQIATLPARPFSEVGLEWPEGERVLRRALAKKPEERHPSMDALVTAFEDACATPPRLAKNIRKRPTTSRKRARAADTLTRAASMLPRRYGLQADATRLGLSQGPTASLYRGAAGIAYALLRHAVLRDDGESLAAADVWIARAWDERENALAFSDGLAGSAAELSPHALFHSETGIQTIWALTRHLNGDTSEALEAVDAFVRLGEAFMRKLPPDTVVAERFGLDATQGAASLLLGATLLHPVCDGHDATHESLLVLGNALSARVDAELRAVFVFQPESRARPYLGFAHGRSGALSSSMGWAQVSGQPLQPSLQAELRGLANHAHHHEDSTCWPIEPGDAPDTSWMGWCHGSAGHLLTFARAARLLGLDEYRALAIGAGHDIWRQRSHADRSLCCGTAGAALALLDLWQLTGDDLWRDRGVQLATETAAAIEQPFDSIGLFRGEVGISLMAAEALTPETASWPLHGSPF